MEKLGPADQLFYALDEAGLPMLMQGASLLDPSDAPGGLDGDRLAEHIAERMRKIPLLREKVFRDPLGVGSPRLAEDPDFDVREHVTRATLRPPGDEAALLRHLEEFSVERLDLDKPLWRFEVIDGLGDGRLALCSKLHHCILDGVGAMEGLASLYDPEPRPAERLRTTSGRPNLREPSALDLTARALGDVATRAVATPRRLRNTAASLLSSLGEALRERVRAIGDAEQAPKAAMTSLNAVVSPDRRAVAFRRYDLREMKALTRKLGCSINDMAMLLCSVALEQYFKDLGETLESDLFALMPINMRAADDASAGNIAAATVVRLHTDTPGLVDRLHAIQRDAREALEKVRPTDGPGTSLGDTLEIFSPRLLDAIAALAGRLISWEAAAHRLMPANVGITNVPGPRDPMYIGGARVEYTIPMVPTAGAAPSWGITSFGDSLTIGFHGCGEAVRDKELLVQGLDKGYAELKGYAAG